MATALDMTPLTMNTADHQQFLKLEDLHTAASPSPDSDAPSSTSPHLTVLVKSKPAKKRKSWGQELPEPKTTLPPRKRAKTDDEKEQRRIERIKRNRAAAHNSRERKRQETDTLAVALAKANAQLDAYRRLHGPLPPSVILPDIRLVDDDADTPAPSLRESYDTAEPALSPDSPDDDDLFDGHIKQEPIDTPFNTTLLQPIFENLDVKSLPLSPLDPIQHSAVSVEHQGEQRHQPALQQHHDQQSHIEDDDLNLSFPQSMGTAIPPPHEYSAPDLLQDSFDSHLEPLAFADGALDTSFNPPLDFSFDDYLYDVGTVDGLGAA